MQVNTVVNKDGNLEEPRVLTLDETDIFLETAQHYRCFNTFRNCSEIACATCAGYFFEGAIGEIDKSRYTSYF